MKFKSVLLAFVLLIIATPIFSQSISIQNIDRSGYPIIKGEILPFDANGKRITNLSKDNWTVYENGVKCDLVEDIECPQATQTEIPVSVVLTIDVSWSMNEINFEGKKRIDIAKNAAKALVNALGSRSECALTTFSTTAKSSTNFSKDRSYVNNQIDGFKLFENTGFYSGFMDNSNGAIEKFKNSSNTKKVIVFLTDGLDNQGFTKEQMNSVIEEANNNNITIYCLSIAQNSPESLKRISQETGGAWYENINSEEQAKNLYLNIIQYEQNQEPCTIVWETEVKQSEPVENMRIKSNQNGIDLTLGKQTLYEISKHKKFGNSKYHNFGEIPEGQGAKIKVDITALGNVNVNKIRVVSNEDFKLKNTSTSNINLTNGETLPLEVMYEPSSKKKSFGSIEIQLSDQTVYFVNLEGGVSKNHELEPPLPNDLDLSSIDFDNIDEPKKQKVDEYWKDGIWSSSQNEYMSTFKTIVIYPAKLPNGRWGFVRLSNDTNYKIPSHWHEYNFDHNNKRISDTLLLFKKGFKFFRFNKAKYSRSTIKSNGESYEEKDFASRSRLYSYLDCYKYSNKDYENIDYEKIADCDFPKDNNYEKFKLGNKDYSLFDMNGKYIFKEGFDDILDWWHFDTYVFEEGRSKLIRTKRITFHYALIKSNSKVGIINFNGEWVIKPEFDELIGYRDVFNTDNMLFEAIGAVKDGKIGYINSKGEWIWGPY